MTCPYLIKVSEDLVQCSVLNQWLGWAHSFPKALCKKCSGKPDTCKLLKDQERSALVARVISEQPRFEKTWKGLPTAVDALQKLIADHGFTKEDARKLLRQARRSGVAASRAADIADACGVGDVSIFDGKEIR